MNKKIMLFSLLILLVLSGCTPEGAKCVKKHPLQYCIEWDYGEAITEKGDWKDKRIDDLNLEINTHILEEYNWVCVEWANKTEINTEWLDNCCVDLDMDLTDENREQQFEGNIGEANVNFSFRKEGNNTAYFGGHMCFDVNQTKDWDFSQIQIGNNQVNLSICESIPQMIETNESICILQRRRGW